MDPAFDMHVVCHKKEDFHDNPGRWKRFLTKNWIQILASF